MARPRDEDARARILQASLEALEELGYPGVTCEAIAERAGASKATIYRWWPHKEAVMLEALRESVAQELPFPDSGSLKEDIRIQLHNFVKLLNSSRGRVFKGLIAAAQSDPKVAVAFLSIWVLPRRAFARRGIEQYQSELRPGLDLGVVLDALYAPLYYRLLIGHEPLTVEFADHVTELVWAGIANLSPDTAAEPYFGKSSMSEAPASVSNDRADNKF
jgi:AcrR family transcriptional regulator